MADAPLFPRSSATLLEKKKSTIEKSSKRLRRELEDDVAGDDDIDHEADQYNEDRRKNKKGKKETNDKSSKKKKSSGGEFALFSKKKAPLQKLRSESKGKRGNDSDNSDEDEDGGKETISIHNANRILSINPLGMRNISIGTRFFAVCHKQRNNGWNLSLPNGVFAFLPWREVSDEIFEEYKTENENVGDDSNNEDMPEDVESILQPGSFVRCVVTKADLKVEGNSNSKTIIVSCRASIVNRFLSIDDIADPKKNQAIAYGSIKSIEDHGYIVNLGVENLTGFISFKNGGGSVEDPLYQPGQPLEAAVIHVPKPLSKGKKEKLSRIVELDPSSKALSRSVTESVSSFSAMQPGLLVKAKVLSTLDNGVTLIAFLEHYAGRVDPNHHPVDFLNGSIASLPQEVKVKLLFVDTQNKVVVASMADHIVSHKPPSKELIDGLLFGKIFENATVQSFDSKLGARFSMMTADDAQIHGFASSRKLVDGKSIDSESKANSYLPNVDDKFITKKFRVGTVHKCRVVGESLLDNLVQVSTQLSIVNAPFVNYAEIHPGMLIDCEIVKVDDNVGVLASVGAHLTGAIYCSHLSDVGVKVPSRKFKIGQKLRCRVIQVDPETKRLQLTNKSTMVNSKLPILASFSDAKTDMVVHGSVLRYNPTAGLIIGFYGNVKGLIPISSLQQLGVENPESAYQVS